MIANILPQLQPPRESTSWTVVRLTSSCWVSNGTVHIAKSIRLLKRRSVGFSLIFDEVSDIDLSDIVDRIVNIYEVPDGVYTIVTVDMHRDWETGAIDDWNYKLIAVND